MNLNAITQTNHLHYNPHTRARSLRNNWSIYSVFTPQKMPIPTTRRKPRSTYIHTLRYKRKKYMAWFDCIYNEAILLPRPRDSWISLDLPSIWPSGFQCCSRLRLSWTTASLHTHTRTRTRTSGFQSCSQLRLSWTSASLAC